jgi:hypothetical protein
VTVVNRNKPSHSSRSTRAASRDSLPAAASRSRAQTRAGHLHQGARLARVEGRVAHRVFEGGKNGFAACVCRRRLQRAQPPSTYAARPAGTGRHQVSKVCLRGRKQRRGERQQLWAGDLSGKALGGSTAAPVARRPRRFSLPARLYCASWRGAWRTIRPTCFRGLAGKLVSQTATRPRARPEPGIAASSGFTLLCRLPARAHGVNRGAHEQRRGRRDPAFQGRVGTFGRRDPVRSQHAHGEFVRLPGSGLASVSEAGGKVRGVRPRRPACAPRAGAGADGDRAAPRLTAPLPCAF